MHIFQEIPKGDVMKIFVTLMASVMTFTLPDAFMEGAKNLRIVFGVLTSIIGIVAGVWATISAKKRVKRDNLAIKKKKLEIEELEKNQQNATKDD